MITLATPNISWRRGIFVRAFGAINYAHAWIDCAVKTGLLNGHGDDRLFTALVDEPQCSTCSDFDV